MKIDKVEIANHFVTILSPDEQGKACPVVYLQDGDSFLDDEAFLTRIVNNNLDRFIIVGITSRNRDDDYTPWPSTIYPEKYQGLGNQYLKILVDDIKDYVDNHYQTASDYDNTALVGASLGGLISMYASVLYPKTFRYIGCISPSFWYENFEAFVLKQKQLNNDIAYYFTIGTGENKSFVEGGITSVEAFNNVINYLLKNNDNINVEINDQYHHKINSFQDRLILFLKSLHKDIKRNKK